MISRTIGRRIWYCGSSRCNFLNQWFSWRFTIGKLDFFAFYLKLPLVDRRVVSWSLFVSLFSVLLRKVIALHWILCDFIPRHFVLCRDEGDERLKIKSLQFWSDKFFRTHRILVAIDSLHGWQMRWEVVLSSRSQRGLLESAEKMRVELRVAAVFCVALGNWRRQAASTGKQLSIRDWSRIKRLSYFH